MPAVSDALCGLTEQRVVPLDTAWLDAPGPDFSDDGLPDPLSRWGRHVRVVCIAGVPVAHGEWTRTHGGQCPPLCRRLPEGAPANSWGPSPAWDAWHAFTRGRPRIPMRPVESPETEITLRNRGGWNQYSCVLPEEPVPLLPELRAPAPESA